MTVFDAAYFVSLSSGSFGAVAQYLTYDLHVYGCCCDTLSCTLIHLVH